MPSDTDSPVCGIDYSLNSPAITFLYKDTFKTYFYSNQSTNYKSILYPIKRGELEYYDKIIYNNEKFLKLIEKENPSKIIIESYSLYSIGRFTSLIENQGYLKVELYKKGFNFKELSPSFIKKAFTGNGRATKLDMINEFQKKTSIDLADACSHLFSKKFIINKEKNNSKELNFSPLTDIADSYAAAFIGKYYVKE